MYTVSKSLNEFDEILGKIRFCSATNLYSLIIVEQNFLKDINDKYFGLVKFNSINELYDGTELYCRISYLEPKYIIDNEYDDGFRLNKNEIELLLFNLRSPYYDPYKRKPHKSMWEFILSEFKEFGLEWFLPYNILIPDYNKLLI